MTQPFPGTQAIIDVILHRADLDCSDVNSTQVQRLRSMLERFLANKIKKEEIKEAFKTETGDNEPVDYLISVLEISPKSEPLKCTQQITSLSKHSRKVAQFWCDIEDKRLLAAIYYFGPRGWNAISAFVGNGRTSAQCLQRWKRGINPVLSKEKFTQEEDTMLFQLVQEYGEKSWAKIAEAFGNRSDVQCRCRYKQLQKRGVSWPYQQTLKQSETPKASPLPAFPPFMSPMPVQYVPAYVPAFVPIQPHQIMPPLRAVPVGGPSAEPRNEESSFLDDFLTRFTAPKHFAPKCGN